MEPFLAVWRDLIHAARSLAKSRAFTVVCVLSLGIGMAPVIGIQYAFRSFTTPPPSVKTDGLVELLTMSVGPREREQRGVRDDRRRSAVGLPIPPRKSVHRRASRYGGPVGAD